MKIEKLLPTGFCYGVMNSYNVALKIIKENLDKKIYMLGWLVHNQHVIDEFLKLGVVILDDSHQSRYSLINEFESVSNAILILSAHGTDALTIALAKSKGFDIRDLTCRYVYKTHEHIKQRITDGYEILFIGKNNHPETNAIMAIDSNIKLVSNIEDIEHIKFSREKIFCTNQTTFNVQILNQIISKLNALNQNIFFQNDICNATRMRQNAITNMPCEIDICLIIGDSKSSNAHELYELAKRKTKTYFIGSIIDIDHNWFLDAAYCAIVGAASTPMNLIDEVYNYLHENFNVNN